MTPGVDQFQAGGVDQFQSGGIRAVGLLGLEHVDTITARNNLAQTLYAQGDVSAARASGGSSGDQPARSRGENDPRTLRAQRNLADIP